VVDLLRISDFAMFFYYSSNTFGAVVEDASHPFTFHQMSLVQFEQLGLCFLDFCPK